MTGGANQDPGQRPQSADELLADLFHAGELLDRHQAQGAELDAARAGITERRSELEAERERAERELVDDFNAQNGRLGMEAEGLRDEERRLRQRQGRQQRRVGKMEGDLRELAADPDAERSTVVAYAAFIATKPDFTAGAVTAMGELDEAVQAAAGQPFVLIQGRHFAFGRIAEETDGLIISTSEEDANQRGVVSLPVVLTNQVKHGRRKPYYGYFSEHFDHPRDMYETYDWVLGRSANAEDVINPDRGWSTMSHFNLEEGNLRLLEPAKVQAADPAEAPAADDPEEEEDGFWSRQDVLFTGPAAQAFMYRVVDARLGELRGELDDSSANAEFGRFMGVAARLGLVVDVREIPIHQQLIQA